MKFLTAFAIIAIILLGDNNISTGQDRIATQAKTSNHFTYLSNLELPDELEFAGEKLPLYIPEVKERAEREFYILLQQPGQIILYLKRAGRYFPLYEPILKEMNVPEDFKYLSVAESALYMSRSKAGALGLWQFIESTGKAFNLQIDDYVDERMHPEKSTYAAMRYLRDAYQRTGSWMLAAAGYNMGVAGVRENVTFQLADDYFDLYLNEETSRYIFRIAIIKEIMKNAGKYGFDVRYDQLYHPEDVKYIEVNDAIPNLAIWANSVGTSYKDVKLLNPWILKRELPRPKSGAWQIAVPEVAPTD